MMKGWPIQKSYFRSVIRVVKHILKIISISSAFQLRFASLKIRIIEIDEVICEATVQNLKKQHNNAFVLQKYIRFHTRIFFCRIVLWPSGGSYREKVNVTTN